MTLGSMTLQHEKVRGYADGIQIYAKAQKGRVEDHCVTDKEIDSRNPVPTYIALTYT